MMKDAGRVVREERHTPGWWRVGVGRGLLAAALSIALLSAWVPHTTVHAYSHKQRAKAEILFREKGCEHCHGAGGVGADRGPSLSAVGKRMSKAQIAQQIRDGGKQMPAFGDVLSQDEVKELVDYLAHNKRLPKGAPTS